MSGKSHIMWQRLKQAVIWIVIYGVTPRGTVFHSQNAEKTGLMPALVLLLPECSSSASNSLAQANIPSGSAPRCPTRLSCAPCPALEVEGKGRAGLWEISVVKKTVCNYLWFKEAVHPTPYIFCRKNQCLKGDQVKNSCSQEFFASLYVNSNGFIFPSIITCNATFPRCPI